MQLHRFSDTVQDLCHEGHSLSTVHFGVGDVSYILKSIDVTNGSVTFRLQAEPQQVVHEGFLGVSEVNNSVRQIDNPGFSDAGRQIDNPGFSNTGRQKSSKSQEKT